MEITDNSKAEQQPTADSPSGVPQSVELVLSDEELALITSRRKTEAKDATTKSGAECNCNAAGVPHYHAEEGIINA